MSWSFQVDDNHSIGIGLDSDGVEYVYGDASSFIFEHELSAPIPSRLKNAAASWSIRTPASSDVSLDPAGSGLYQTVRADPDNVHAMIQFHGANEYNRADLIGATICVPQNRFAIVRKQLEIALTSRLPTRTIIVLDFHQFDNDEGRPIPTLPTFMTYGKPVMSSGMQITTRRIVD